MHPGKLLYICEFSEIYCVLEFYQYLFTATRSCLSAFYPWSTDLTMFTAYMLTSRPGSFENANIVHFFENLFRFKFYLIVEKLAKCYNSHFGTNNVFLTEDRLVKNVKKRVLKKNTIHCQGCLYTGRTGRWSRRTSTVWGIFLWGTQRGGNMGPIRYYSFFVVNFSLFDSPISFCEKRPLCNFKLWFVMITSQLARDNNKSA